MANQIIKQFIAGVHNLISDEEIPASASQDSKNFITKDGSVMLAYGRKEVGTEGGAGKCYALHYGYTVDGTKVLYRKINTKIQYLDGSTWTDVITGLSATDTYSFANSSSLSGSFTFINGAGGYYKINNAHPASALQMYNSAKNFHGKIIIDVGRTLLWDRDDDGNRDRTGLYGSKIDPQDATVYTTVTSEAIGALGSTVYSGTLAANAATRNHFGLSFVATVAAGTETFQDNYDGTLTSNYGGTGTINYATGAYSVTFSDTTTGAVTADYQWEDSNIGGITDFTYSSPRVAAEGFQFPQDEGGDAILNILIGQDGAYYSAKKQSFYRLYIDQSDAMGVDTTNKVYRKDIGIPNWKACISTSKGIVFMNTANPENPELTILQKNILDSIEPIALLKHFDFSAYNYDDCIIDTFDRYILVACKDGNHNDTLLLCDITAKTVDIISYKVSAIAKNAGDLYIGSPLTESVYQIFNGFDDMDLALDNYWKSKGEKYGVEELKKTKWLRFMGSISSTQTVEVYVSYDDAGFSLIGTIVGSGSYVDASNPQTIGVNMVGTEQIGGGDLSQIYEYFMELKLKSPKFRKRTIKLVATGIGYFDFHFIEDDQVLLFNKKIPKRFRQKQNVSVDGLSTNQ